MPILNVIIIDFYVKTNGTLSGHKHQIKILLVINASP